MVPFASRLLLPFIVIGMHAQPLFADELSSRADSQERAGALPAFISDSGLTPFSSAVVEKQTEVSARQAAEALSAKFSDITTSSIATDAPSQPPHVAASASPPVIATGQVEARSIMLAAKHSDDPKDSLSHAAEPREKAQVKTRRIPRSEIGKKDAQKGPSDAGQENLASIGDKVGFFNLLMNPALWH